MQYLVGKPVLMRRDEIDASEPGQQFYPVRDKNGVLAALVPEVMGDGYSRAIYLAGLLSEWHARVFHQYPHFAGPVSHDTVADLQAAGATLERDPAMDRLTPRYEEQPGNVSGEPGPIPGGWERAG